MRALPNSLEDLINQFSKLPGIGKKTAERLAIFILKEDKKNVNDFSESLKTLKNNIKTCKMCHCFIEDECLLCEDESADNIICIVEDPTDVFIIDKSGYKGKYHVLGGLISPLDGITADDLNFNTLLNRIENIEEIVVAFNPSSEGDMTNLYLAELLDSYDVKITRLARGVPMGSSLEFIDQVTLTHSLNDRVSIK